MSIRWYHEQDDEFMQVLGGHGLDCAAVKQSSLPILGTKAVMTVLYWLFTFFSVIVYIANKDI